MPSPRSMPSPRIARRTRRRKMGAVTVVTIALALGGVAAIAAQAGAKGKAPVKLSGKVNNKGKATVKNGEIELEADDYYFKSTYLKGTAGDVTVEIENEGGATHSFTIDGQVDQVIDPGKKATVTVALTDGKPVAFYCKFHKSLGMQGAFYTAAGGTATGSDTKSNGSGGGIPGY